MSNMFAMNQITLTGGVAIKRDGPDTVSCRYTQSGTAILEFPLAIEEYNTGTKETKTSFIPVVMWGKLAENASGQIRRGMKVNIWGRLQNNDWEGSCQQCGKAHKVVKWQVVAEGYSINMTREQRESYTPGSGGGGNYGGGGYNNRQQGGGGYSGQQQAQQNEKIDDYDIGDLGPPLDMDDSPLGGDSGSRFG